MPSSGLAVDVQVVGMREVAGTEIEADVAGHGLEPLGVQERGFDYCGWFAVGALVAELEQDLLAHELEPVSDA